MLPWGTPERAGNGEDLTFQTDTHCVLEERYNLNQYQILPLILTLDNFARSME